MVRSPGSSETLLGRFLTTSNRHGHYNRGWKSDYWFFYFPHCPDNLKSVSAADVKYYNYTRYTINTARHSNFRFKTFVSIRDAHNQRSSMAARHRSFLPLPPVNCLSNKRTTLEGEGGNRFPWNSYNARKSMVNETDMSNVRWRI